MYPLRGENAFETLTCFQYVTKTELAKYYANYKLNNLIRSLRIDCCILIHTVVLFDMQGTALPPAPGRLFVAISADTRKKYCSYIVV